MIGMNTETIQNDFTAASLAKLAGVSRVYVARLCREGKIPAKKYATVWIISREDGQRWLEARRATPDL